MGLGGLGSGQATSTALKGEPRSKFGHLAPALQAVDHAQLTPHPGSPPPPPQGTQGMPENTIQSSEYHTNFICTICAISRSVAVRGKEASYTYY